MRQKKIKSDYFIIIVTALFLIQPLKAQVTIGSIDPPQSFSILELIAKNKDGGLRLPQLTSRQRDSIADFWKEATEALELAGLVIYNTTTSCLEFWNNEDWISLCSSVYPDSIKFALPPDGITEKIVNNAGGFNVWGYSYDAAGSWASPTNKTTLFNGVNVYSNDGGDTWGYDPSPTPWPSDKKVSFFAYVPTSGATLNGSDASGVQKINFAVNDNPTNQNDLLVANQALDQTGPNPVPLLFNSALARVSFSALKESTITEDIRITGIELKNIYSNGTTSLQTPVSWAVNTGVVKNYSLTNSSGGGLRDDITLTDSEQSLMVGDKNLFLMPQTLNRVGTDMVVSYTTSSGASFGIIRSFTPAQFTSTTEWLPGNIYNYKLLIDRAMVPTTFWLPNLTTGVDEFSTLSSSNWGELVVPPPYTGSPAYTFPQFTYTAVSPPTELSSGLILGNSVATFGIPANRNVNDEYSVNVTVKGAIPQPGKVESNDASDITSYPRTIVAISPASSFYLCWIGIYGNYLHVYSYTNMSAKSGISSELTQAGFISIDISPLKLGVDLSNKYINIQVTAKRTTTAPAVTGYTTVYLNGGLANGGWQWTFPSGSTEISTSQITLGDLRTSPPRYLRYRGAAYNFALYNKELDQTAVTWNWDYTKRQLGITP